jgi:hypothetical protein
MMTIINESTNKILNETWETSKKYMDKLKILPLACNWEHIQVAKNIVNLIDLTSQFFILIHSVITIIRPCWLIANSFA